MMYCIQILAKSNDARSKPVTGTPEQLVEVLRRMLAKENPVIKHDDYVIVISELDPNDDEQFSISEMPLFSVARFNQFLSRSLKVESQA